jgi:hypothetical protein
VRGKFTIRCIFPTHESAFHLGELHLVGPKLFCEDVEALGGDDVGALVGPLVGALVGPLVGPLVGLLVGSTSGSTGGSYNGCVLMVLV